MTIVDFPLEGTIGVSLLPKRYDIVIYQGDTFNVVLNFKDADSNGVSLAGFTAKTQFRKTGVATPAISLSSGNGITLNADSTNGKVRIVTTTSSLVGDYTWDFELTDAAGNTRTYIGGKVTVTTDVSDETV